MRLIERPSKTGGSGSPVTARYNVWISSDLMTTKSRIPAMETEMRDLTFTMDEPERIGM